MTILIEGFDPDALALARRFAEEGRTVRLASAAAAPENAAALRELGIHVEPDTDLDADPGPAEVAYLDVWTPDVAPRTQRLRAQGTRVSCLGDLLLERWAGPTIGITGTAGKTTATALTADAPARRRHRPRRLLRRESRQPVAHGRPPRQSRRGRDSRSLLELTSSHLAFMATSPDDRRRHLLLARPPRAPRLPRRLPRSEGDDRAPPAPDRQLVLDTTDEAVASFAALAPGEVVAFSATGAVERGAFVRSGMLTVRWDDAETAVGSLADLPLPQAHLTSVLAAVTVALAAGAPPSSLADGLRAARPLPYRAVEVATIGGVPVVDDGLAATPAKASATLAGYPRQSVVLIAGGVGSLGAGAVHAAPEEQPLFEQACDEIARAVRLAVVFGPAAARLEGALSARGVPLRTTATLDEAFELAAAATGAAAASTGGDMSVLLFSPLFPVDLADRERFAALARAGRGATARA